MKKNIIFVVVFIFIVIILLLTQLWNGRWDFWQGRQSEADKISYEADVLKTREKIFVSCGQKGGEMYVVPATPVSFCYFHQWGEPVVQELNRKGLNGKLNRVVFVSNGKKEAVAPKLWYAKEIKGGDISELGKLCLDCQDISDKYGAKTVEVAGKQAILFPSYEKKWDVYYLGDALKGYDIVFILPVADLFRNAFLEDFWFDPLL